MDTIELKNSPYVRLNFADDLVKGKDFDGKTKYLTAFLVPKDERAFDSVPGLTDSQKKQVLEMATKYKDKVLKAANSEKAKAAKIDNLFKDGDEAADTAIEGYKEENPGKDVPGYLDNTRGFYICNASSNFEQVFYGPKGDKMPLDWAEENIYSGCWVRIATRGYKWSYSGKKGWSLGLAGSVQKWTDASKFGGSSAAEEVEETLEVPQAKDEDFDTID